jgi:hypothetical protein
VKTLSGARKADFALSAWSSLLVGWLKRLNGLNGRFFALSKLPWFYSFLLRIVSFAGRQNPFVLLGDRSITYKGILGFSSH